MQRFIRNVSPIWCLGLILMTVVPTAARAQSKWTVYSDEGSRVKLYIEPGYDDTLRSVVRLLTQATVGETFLEHSRVFTNSSDYMSIQCTDWTYAGVLNNSLVVVMRDYMIFKDRDDRYDSLTTDRYDKTVVGSKQWGNSVSGMCIVTSENSSEVETLITYVPLRESGAGYTLLVPATLWNQGSLTMEYEPLDNGLEANWHPLESE